MSGPQPVGMFPDRKMAECESCEHWSYMAASTGLCLGCEGGPTCGKPVWGGRYSCVLPSGHEGHHEAPPIGVTICGDRMVEHSREFEQVRWCFQCRKHLMHDLVVLVPDGLSYFGPIAKIECHGCGGDHADFPGTYRDGPRYGFGED